MASVMDYTTKRDSSQRQLSLAKILKVKSEQRRGSMAVVEWMSRNCKFVAGDYKEEHLNIAEAIKGTPKPDIQ